MANCTTCAAPLRPNLLVCEYCSVRNDLDLHSETAFDVVGKESKRKCPNCAIRLHIVDLKIEGATCIERCDKCFGMFFDRGEIEEVLAHGVSNDNEINLKLLDNVNQDRYQPEKGVKYRVCPVCDKFMDRRGFGYRSGVIIDYCKRHGIWLENGELVHLLEWKKAGGRMIEVERMLEANRNRNSEPEYLTSQVHGGWTAEDQNVGVSLDGPLVDVLRLLLGRIFGR